MLSWALISQISEDIFWLSVPVPQRLILGEGEGPYCQLNMNLGQWSLDTLKIPPSPAQKKKNKSKSQYISFRRTRDSLAASWARGEEFLGDLDDVLELLRKWLHVTWLG